jgi:SpoVK/Ycf46/Vps4 family AAA+-type ATPase
MVPAAAALLDRPPVFILAGDVGTGKTALAETFGDPLARALGLPVFAYRLSLAARGSGLVGEITTLVRDAFATVGDEAKRATRTGKTRSAFILLIDEADSLAQSRQQEQMHHEDRAGVNALIRGIDELARDRLPAIIVLCTNRLDAIDPAVQRRSAEPFLFTRPNAAQREAVLRTYLYRRHGCKRRRHRRAGRAHWARRRHTRLHLLRPHPTAGAHGCAYRVP